MYNKLKLTIAAVLTAFTGIAQDVHYTPVETNPDLYSRTVLNLGLIGMSAGKDISFGGSVKLETMIGLKIAPYIGYRGTYFSVNSITSDDKTALPADDLKKDNHFEIGGSYFLYDENISGDVPVVLSSQSRGRYTITHYTTIPSEIKHMLGVSGGFFSERTVSQFKSDVSKYYTFTNATTAIAGTNTSLPDLILQNTATSVFAGGKYRNVKRTIVQVENLGKRSNNTTTEIYLDLSMALTSSVSDISIPVIDSDWVTPGRYKVNVKNDGISNFGFRLGWSRNTSKNFGTFSNLEVGKQAGLISGNSIFGKGYYIRIMYGISIGSGKYFRLQEPVPAKKSATPTTIKNKDLNSI